MAPRPSNAPKPLALVGALLLAACSSGESPLEDLASRSLAQLDGALDVPGLQAPVEIIRDDYGVPHIYAENEEDLFFAQGYVMAQDRLWQMEMWRRWHEGRLAEVCLLYTSPSPRDLSTSRMPSSA